jgi:hypothetical protein
LPSDNFSGVAGLSGSARGVWGMGSNHALHLISQGIRGARTAGHEQCKKQSCRRRRQFHERLLFPALTLFSVEQDIAAIDSKRDGV